MGHASKGVTSPKVYLAIVLVVCVSSALSAAVKIPSQPEETEVIENVPAAEVEATAAAGIVTDSPPTTPKTPVEDQQKVTLLNKTLPKAIKPVKFSKSFKPSIQKAPEDREVVPTNAPPLPLVPLISTNNSQSINGSNLQAEESHVATNLALPDNSIFDSNPIKLADKDKKLSETSAEELQVAPQENEGSTPSNLNAEQGDLTSQVKNTDKAAISDAPPVLIEPSGTAAPVAPVVIDSNLGAANSSIFNVSNTTNERSNDPNADNENEDDEDDEDEPTDDETTESQLPAATPPPVPIQTSPPDLAAFKYLIKANVCPAKPEAGSPILAIILVLSNVRNVELRNNIRQTFPAKEIEELGLRRVFVLASGETATTDLAEESDEFADIVQFNTEESFTELPKTVLLALKYAALNCKKAKFFIKTEDNILIDYYRVQEELNAIDDADKDKIIGHVWKAMTPVRPHSNPGVDPKYFTTVEEYPADTFPTYVSGLFNAVSYKTAKKLLKTSEKEKYYKTEDVYITGMLAKAAGLKHLDLSEKFTFEPNTLHCCVNEEENIVYKCQHMVGYGHGPPAQIAAASARIRKQIEYCHINQNCPELTKDDLPLENSICF